MRLPNLHHCMRQQSLVIIVRVCIWCIVPISIRPLFEYKPIVRHLGIDDVIGHKHVQGIVTRSIVIARTHTHLLLAQVVIPFCGITIYLISIGDQVIDIIDTVLLEHFIALGKDGKSFLTLHLTCRTDTWRRIEIT